MEQVMAEIKRLEDIVLSGSFITKKEAFDITRITDDDVFALFISANKIRSHFRGNRIELCCILNAKSGACPEDCSFCAQSSKSSASIHVYPLVRKEMIIKKAEEAKEWGIKRFSIVTSGKRLSKEDLSTIIDTIPTIRNMGVLPCASLGLLKEKDFLLLKEAGLDRYHHNLETSERLFPSICSTHGYKDKIETIEAAKLSGLSVCSGGIFGMGETWEDRINMAFTLRDLDVDSVAINFLIPIKGTPLANMPLLHPFEALKIVSLFRYILPQKEIRICGGRLQILGEFNSMIFLSGADGILTGNYLTTNGRNPKEDLKLIKTYGLTI